METPQISLLIVDDHPFLVEGLHNLLLAEKHIIVQSVATNGKQALNILAYQEPHIVLLDINMPELNGLEVIQEISKNYPKIRIIVLTTYNEQFLINKTKDLGAHGYLLKTSNFKDILKAIEIVKDGGIYFPDSISKIYSEPPHKVSFLNIYKLTPRELEIIHLISRGLSNKQIADTLFLSLFTVETHRKNIMLKLNLKKPSQLWSFLLKNNL